MNKILFIFCTFFIYFFTPCHAVKIEKVVLWGHKLHSHTQSYIHAAFEKAFSHLGYETLWLDDDDAIEEIDFSNALFITEGQVDQNIPLLKDCYYVLHNCDRKRYLDTIPQNHCITLQVYSDSILKLDHLVKIDDCMYYDYEEFVVYMPWATDLLPHEIEENKKFVRVKNNKKRKVIHWVGTIGGGTWGNLNELNPFIEACRENKIQFIHHSPWSKKPVSFKKNKELIIESYIAPTIVGAWQEEHGYIPCRIFKNISYGKLGVTNSSRVFELFKGQIVYNSDTYQLFYDAEAKMNECAKEDIFELMDFVKDNHTYLNRIEFILNFFNEIQSDHFHAMKHNIPSQ